MRFTRSNADLKIIQKLSDYPNMEDGLSSEELKEKFDEGAIKVQQDLNNLMDELEQKAEGFEGSRRITSGKLFLDDPSGNTIHDKLVALKAMIDDVILGSIPDNSITESKIEENYRNLLALKNKTLQVNLNAEMLDGVKLANIYLNSKYHLPTFSKIEEPIVFNNSLIPTMNNTSQDGFSVSHISLFDNDSSTHIDSSSGKTLDVVIQFPYYVRVDKLRFLHWHNGSYNNVSYTLNIYGSNNGNDYELMDSKVVSERAEDPITSEYEINTKYCKFIKLSFVCKNATQLYNINIIKGARVNETDINRFDLNYKLDTYERGQKLSIIVPTNFTNCGLNTKMKIGDLEYIQMPNDIQADEYIDLMYDGTSFVRR